MRRIAFYLFYDEQGIVDDYIQFKLEALTEHVEKIVFICNSKLNKEGRDKIEAIPAQIICRKNIGFDVWGYKEGLETIGLDTLTSEYDELLLLNYTFFAPIFPFKEMFDWSNSVGCDFWGISEHAEVSPNPFTGKGVLPRHIQSHFIAVKNKMFSSFEFKKYWEQMPEIKSYTDSILQHESQFTKHFNDRGFSSSCYLPLEDYKTKYPTFDEIETTLTNRSPIIKRRPFFHEPLWLDKNAIDLSSVRDVINEKTDYNFDLIKQNLLRTVKPRTLYANQEMLKIFPKENIVDEVKLANLENKKVAIIAHLYYVDMWEELKPYLDRIPLDFDLFISTATEDNKKEIIELITRDYPKIEVMVRVVEQNRGRDMSSLFITFKDVCSTDKYDFVCRLHSKKSPQNGANAALHFKEHMLENLLASPSYIVDVLDLMNQESVGLVIPPVVHIGYPTLGHAWFTNKPPAKEWAEKLGIETPFDDNTPIAAYGTMFWFKPAALRKMFTYDFKWEDFNKEPAHNDGGLAHVLERLIAYASASAGYEVFCVMNSRSAEKNYVHLETKMIAIMSQLPNGDVFEQYQNLIHNRSGSLNGAIRQLMFIVKTRMLRKYPRLSRLLKYPYKIALKSYKILCKRNLSK